jgi:hypothetical protein
MNRQWRFLMAGAVVAVMAYGLFLYLRARSNLVTLDVRNAEVRLVVRDIEWQTWEEIFVHPKVEGKVTLKVRKVPLEEVLRLIGEQTGSRGAAVYPLYTTRATLRQLKETVRAGQTAGERPWKAWQEQPAFRFAGPLGDELRNENQLISVELMGKDAGAAAQALNRFSHDRVVPEDDTPGMVNLKLAQATLPAAVAQVARQVKRDWTVFYLLSPARFMGRPAFASGPAAGLTPEKKAQFDQQFEASLATLSPEERALAQQRREKMEALRNLPADQRGPAMQQAFQQMMSNPGMQAQIQSALQGRMATAIKDSTPDQRVERTRTIVERRKMFENAASNDSAK